MRIAVSGLIFIFAVCTGLALPASAQDTPQTHQKTVKLSPEQLEKIRLVEIARAAKLYTQIAFSDKNQRKMQEGLPLAKDEFQTAIRDLRARFQACMESGFEARMDNAFDAQVLRKTIESVLTTKVAEPKKANTILPAFTATDTFCSGKIEIWMAGAIK